MIDLPVRKRIITISGTPCSGKSTVNKILTNELNYAPYSVGSKVKQLALEQCIEPETFYRDNVININGKRESLDEYLDHYQKKLGETKDRFILDSRLGFYFIPQSFRVFLTCDLEETARRAYYAKKNNPAYATKEYQSIAKSKQTLIERMEFEKENYFKKYGIPDFHQSFYFDLFIDTTIRNQKSVAEEILEKYSIYEQRTREIEIFIKGFQTMITGEVVYCSCPLTGGEKLYEVMEKYGVKDRKELSTEVFEKEVMEWNAEQGRIFGDKIQRRTKSTIILPVKIGISGWSQKDYMDAWKEIIRTKTKITAFEKGWEYSNGSVEEYLLSLIWGKLVYDHNYHKLKKEKALEIVSNAVEKIHNKGFKCLELKFFLEQLKRQ
ncbi:AAA family ATPase [Candidatus Woesearchaeota archaeon]|nr:AAA family ATPase [Candidatus Woesearchaeota archaeon]